MPRARAGDPRSTVQKEAITAALAQSPGFVSAQDLHQRLNDEGNPVGLATVYRRLNALVEAGGADTIPVPGGQLFRACRPGGHHHLVCEDCGKAVEIDPPSEDWLLTAAQRNGYTITRHLLEAFGRCSDCAAT
ncbi:Fur family transcriptional regulator [Microbacterium sp. BWT-B31]|uniref:Fur family transcriptional regulator n=1 Tax=Microbacterium sp. BWT-B31 TaxID=3232072 RepID=UPI003526D6FD